MKRSKGALQFLLPNLGHYLSRGQKSGEANVAVLIKQEVFCGRDAMTFMVQILR